MNNLNHKRLCNRLRHFTPINDVKKKNNFNHKILYEKMDQAILSANLYFENQLIYINIILRQKMI